jgi:hypothetical protein
MGLLLSLIALTFLNQHIMNKVNWGDRLAEEAGEEAGTGEGNVTEPYGGVALDRGWRFY